MADIVPKSIFDQIGSKEISRSVISQIKDLELNDLNNWLKKNTVFVGKGSSRSSYILVDQTVLKIGFNPQGILQNKQEFQNSSGNYSCFPMIYEKDPSFKFLRVELCREATESDFKNLFKSIKNPLEFTVVVLLGVFSDLDFDQAISEISRVLGIKEQKIESIAYSEEISGVYYRLITNNLKTGSEKNLRSLVDFYRKNGIKSLVPTELLETENFGVVYRDKEPQIVVLDCGLSEGVRISYSI